jgi:16S rRNA (uracil1498-N3)-methyltransferase
VVVASLDGPELDPEDAHHLGSVLRLRPGEAVGATDGRGGLVPCVYAGKGRLEVAGPAVVSPARRPVLTVGLTPVKGDRPEWAVQKLTELGVDRILVLSAARSVVRWDGPRAAGHLERLRRVARSAVMQSRQVWLPEVEGVVPVGSLAGGDAFLADMGGGPPGPGVTTVLIGPEGGWSAEERAGAGDRVVGLAPSVLRAETAAVAAGVLLTAGRAGVVGWAGPAGASPAAAAAPSAAVPLPPNL